MLFIQRRWSYDHRRPPAGITTIRFLVYAPREIKLPAIMSVSISLRVKGREGWKKRSSKTTRGREREEKKKLKKKSFTWLPPKDSALSSGRSGCCRPAVWRTVSRDTRRLAWGTWRTRRTSWRPAHRRSASARSVDWACSWWRARGRAARSGKRVSRRVPSCHPPLARAAPATDHARRDLWITSARLRNDRSSFTSARLTATPPCASAVLVLGTSGNITRTARLLWIIDYRSPHTGCSTSLFLSPSLSLFFAKLARSLLLSVEFILNIVLWDQFATVFATRN